MTVYGWDVSNHDWDRHPVDLADARKAGISLVTHKATEGDWYEDPYFEGFAKQAAHVDFPVIGTYHVLNHGINVVRQTDYWIDFAVAKFPGLLTHPCVIWQIDAEPLDGYDAPTKAEILACGRRITSRLKLPNQRVVVYGPNWVYGDRLRGLPYRLWASSYVAPGRSFRALYPGDQAPEWGAYSGQTPLILQYTSGAVIGNQHTCDANAIRVGNEATLQALFGAAPAPAIKGDFTMDAEAKAAFAALNKRFDSLPSDVWTKPLQLPGGKPWAASSWLVESASHAATAVTVATQALEAAKAAAGQAQQVAVDAAAVASDITTRVLANLAAKFGAPQ